MAKIRTSGLAYENVKITTLVFCWDKILKGEFKQETKIYNTEGERGKYLKYNGEFWSDEKAVDNHQRNITWNIILRMNWIVSQS